MNKSLLFSKGKSFAIFVILKTLIVTALVCAFLGRIVELVFDKKSFDFLENSGYHDVRIWKIFMGIGIIWVLFQALILALSQKPKE